MRLTPPTSERSWGSLLAAVAMLLLLAAACSNGSSDTTDPPANDVVLRVVRDGAVAADWTLADLEEAVSYSDLTIDGSDQQGPLLLDVLAASGITDWESGRVSGWGEGRSFEITVDITAADVDRGWILDVNKQGKLKLASESLPRQQWVRDVSEITLP